MSDGARISYATILTEASKADVHLPTCVVQSDILTDCDCTAKAALRALAAIAERAEKLFEFVRQSGDPDASLTEIELQLAVGYTPPGAGAG